MNSKYVSVQYVSLDVYISSLRFCDRRLWSVHIHVVVVWGEPLLCANLLVTMADACAVLTLGYLEPLLLSTYDTSGACIRCARDDTFVSWCTPKSNKGLRHSQMQLSVGTCDALCVIRSYYADLRNLLAMSPRCWRVAQCRRLAVDTL
jgi:hypothetical protein